MRTKEVILRIRDSAKRGNIPLIVTPGTSWSVTYTIITDITKEKRPSVIILNGRLTILSRVQSTRFTIPRTTANNKVDTKPFAIAIPGIILDWAKK